MKKNENNSKQNNIVNEDMNQLLIKLGWGQREILSSSLALYGTILVVIVRIARYITLLDEINKTNNAESTTLMGMPIPDIIETFPRIIDELFLILAINSTETSFEDLVNKNNLSSATESDIINSRKGLEASFFAYLAAKISYDIDVGTQFF